MNRRQFLTALGASAAVSAVPGALRPAFAAVPGATQAAADLTTLAQTLRAGRKINAQGYRLLATGPGEAHTVRDELVKAEAGRERRRRSLLSFVHLTDQHIIDVQSPSRVEFLDRYSDQPCDNATFFESAFRPQEAANARIADAMLRRLRRIGVSPVTGAPTTAAVCTGDNTDNQQVNELEVFLAVMDGGRVTPQSGNPNVYQGVQKPTDPLYYDRAYWHPDPPPAGREPDRYKTRHGFPESPGWLERALSAFDSPGIGLPWYSAYGNHDGLAQGNAPVNPAFETIGTQGVKVVGSPDSATCDSFSDPSRFEELFTQPGLAAMPVEADAGRRYIARPDWIQGHLDSPGLPKGHGFTRKNVEENIAYYTADVGSIRWIVLDTVNPGGFSEGNIGQRQLDWLAAELARAQKERKLTMLFSHHGLRSLNNPLQNPDPATGADGNDNPRYNAGAVHAVVSKHSCVIAWVNGHTHENIIETQEGPFWDIGTAAHIDFPAQSRLIEVVDNRDGTLSIFTTMVDHEDGADGIAAFARELMANDPQKGFGYGEGKAEDRNAELLLPHPFARTGNAGRDETGVGNAGDGRGGAGGAGAGDAAVLPATGGGSLAGVGGAVAVAAAAGLLRLRDRVPEQPAHRSTHSG